MRLVSLWWELPPRLTSNNNIWDSGLQQKSVDYFSQALTSIPAQSSNALNLRTETLFSEALREAGLKYLLVQAGQRQRYVQLPSRVQCEANVLVHPLGREVGGEIEVEDRRGLGGIQPAALRLRISGLTSRATPAFALRTRSSLNHCMILKIIRLLVRLAFRPRPGPPR